MEEAGSLSPRPQLDHIRRPQILSAAAEVIAERGVASTRIADVAERVGTSAPAVLYWFGSKDELLAEALTVEEDAFYEVITERLAELSGPRQQLRLLIEACAGQYDWTLWMELWTRALRDRGVLAARQRLDERWRGEIARLVRAGRDAGDFEIADPDEAASIIASLIDGLAVQATLGDPAVSSERMRDLTVHVAELVLGAELPPLGRTDVAKGAAAP
jgi:AcrR family transcriptional regulator